MLNNLEADLGETSWSEGVPRGNFRGESKHILISLILVHLGRFCYWTDGECHFRNTLFRKSIMTTHAKPRSPAINTSMSPAKHRLHQQ